MKKRFFRLYYRRSASKTITDLSCVIGTTVTKAGATFNTEGAIDQLFVGMSVVLDGNAVIRIASITSDTEFELVSNHDASETITGVFTTPVLANMMGSEFITEVDSYWTEFKDVEVGANVKVEKGDSQQTSIGDNRIIEEKGMLSFNVLGFGESSSSPNVEGRFDELRTDLNQKKVDILLFNDSDILPESTAYYNIFGNCHIEIEAGALPKIIIDSDETKTLFTEADIKIFAPIIDTPVCTPDSGTAAAVDDVIITCVTVGVRMYMTYGAAPTDPTESDTEVYNGETYDPGVAGILKVKAFKNGMTESAVGSGTYT